MASSSSSQKQNRELNAFSGIEPAGKRRMVSESSRLFDVFINHRGPDVKQTLATELYESLGQKGIQAFLDSQEKELGNSFPSTIETAIRSAKVHIAIFSKRYAESPWCLAELLLMLETKAKIIPVFYELEPWELRHIEKGIYADAFKKYEEKGRYREKLNEWKEALQTLSFIAGVEFHSFKDCKIIVAAVEKEVKRKQCLHVAKYPVGLNNLVKDFERCLDELVQDFENQCGLEKRKDKPNIVGIFGMGGVGKTTLAKELFNRKHSDYSRSCFLFDVREASVRSELPLLQRQLLKDLFDPKDPSLSFSNKEEGKSCLNDHLQRSSLNFLIVVDDIDHVEQLDALLIMDILNKTDNSLIIVTTRDVGVVINAGITVGYPFKGMDRNHGRELFCWHAFDQPLPQSGYERLVDQFVDVCRGLPLSLQVLGRLVRGRPHEYWELKLLKTREMLPKDVKQRLRISFDALEDEEKQVFMDIAYFFVGKEERMAERILEASGWNAKNAPQTLKDKCLIEGIDIMFGGIELRMHDHLRDLGREMALELSSPKRLWHPRDLESLQFMGLKTILAKINARCFHSIHDNSLGCKVTFLLGQSDSCVEMSASLLWLELDGLFFGAIKSQASLPSWIPLQNLQCLKIRRIQFKTLFENRIQISHYRHQTSCRDLSGSGDPIQLRDLIITDCPELKEFPSLSRLKRMEKIETGSCDKLQNIMLVSGSGELTKLRDLIIDDCPELRELPSLSRLKCIEKIYIAWCDKLQTIMLPPTLISLSVQSCRDLQRVSGSGELTKLRDLIINDCPEVKEFPSLSRLNCMEKIDIVSCDKLENIMLPLTLISLSVKSCRDFRRVSGSELTKLRDLIINDCPKLRELPSLSRLKWMEKIDIGYCDKLQNIMLPPRLISLSVQSCRDLQRVSGSGELTKLGDLIFKECPEVEELPSLYKLNCMNNIEIYSCDKLQNITLPSTLTNLSVQSCRDLQRVSGNGDLIKIKEVIVSNCPELIQLGSIDLIKLTELIIDECSELEKLPGLYRLSCMEKITINSCAQLQSISLPTTVVSLSVCCCRDLQRVIGSSDLIKLTKLNISECPELEELPCLSSLSCMKKIEIRYCEKLHNITLPKTLISLCVQSCRGLQSLGGSGDLIKLTKLFISECPELEQLLSSLSRLSCVENIEIHSCEKIQNFMLPSTIVSLSVRSCRDLQRIVGFGEANKLTELFITECPKLDELSSLSRLNCIKKIEIDCCEKLEKISGIEERSVQCAWIQLGSNTVIRNCIHMLKSVPRKLNMIGRAVDGAESSLSKFLFYDAYIGPDALTEIVTQNRGAVDISEWCKNWDETRAAVIVCFVVVVDSSTSADDINFSLGLYKSIVNFPDETWNFPDETWPKVREGEWIITMLASDNWSYDVDFKNVEDVLSRKGVMKKAFRVEVKKSEEWKCLSVLSTIVARLYQ